jgi:four helix bundle protein
MEMKGSKFGHERLKVYDKSLEFVGLSTEVLGRVTRKVAACDHLARATESIPLNIAHASSSWSPTERITYLGHANGSSLECAACLDVIAEKQLLTSSEVLAGKRQLREIVNGFGGCRQCFGQESR